MTAATLSKDELEDLIANEKAIIAEGYHDPISEEAARDYIRELKLDLKALKRAR